MQARQLKKTRFHDGSMRRNDIKIGREQNTVLRGIRRTSIRVKNNPGTATRRTIE